MANPYVGAGFDQYVGTRTQSGQTQVEFFNKQTNQGFSNPNDLLRFIQPYAGNQMVDESNVFNVLSQGVTPRAAAIDNITNQLNQQQQQTFGEQSAPKRQSSSLTENK